MGMLDFDDCDFAYDEMHAQLKRKRFDLTSPDHKTSFFGGIETTMKDNASMEYDDDYECFLKVLLEDSEPGHSGREGEDDDDGDDDDDDDDKDPQYKMFMERVKEHGKSYILEVAVQNGVAVFIKYEAEEGSDDICGPQARKTLSNIVKEKIEAAKNSNTVHKMYQVESPRILRSCMRKEKRNAEKIEAAKTSNTVHKMYQVESPRILRSCMRKEKRNAVFEKDLSSKSEPYHKSDMVSSMEDSYELFLSSVKTKGDHLVLQFKNCEPVTYEKDDVENSSDSRILKMDNSLFCEDGNDTPFGTSRGFDASMLEDDCKFLGNHCRNDHSQFRDKLMDILRKPYDKHEFDELWRDLRARLPMERSRVLRGRTTSYSADKCGKSYLDHHSDLKKKIKAFQHDRSKLLNIFRGFFYWLTAFGCASIIQNMLNRKDMVSCITITFAFKV
ncbi:unnamed protein product [Ilex paraguariensis]|uniref:Uncharacterized protein n=1 Tax=Ilex paraguariensis TaxID=185542 RepID=A0ABC8S494_9AQUA